MRTVKINPRFWIRNCLAAGIFAVGVFGFSLQTYATPTISSAPATVTDGQAITIAGSLFGTNGPSILFYDDFESGTVGQDIKTGSNSATIGQWSSLQENPPKYSNAYVHSGTKSFKGLSVIGVEGNTGAWITLPNITDIFLSYWNYVPTDSPWSGEGTAAGINWKHVWMMQTGTGDNDLVMPVQLPTEWHLAGNDSVYSHALGGSSIPSMAKGSWNRFWFYIKGGTSSDGIARWYELNNSGVRTLINDTNVTTLAGADVWQKIAINGYTRQHDSGTMPSQYFDDIYIATGSNAQARVEIGNAATYAASTNLTIATVNSWSDSSIYATVRQGSFASGQAYLYVFDADGSVNGSGYPVTFSSDPPDVIPPASPSGLSVS